MEKTVQKSGVRIHVTHPDLDAMLNCVVHSETALQILVLLRQGQSQLLFLI